MHIYTNITLNVVVNLANMLVVCWLQGFSLESACLLGIVKQQLATICHYCVAQSYAAIANTFHMYIPLYSRGLLYIVVLSFNQATTFPQSFPNFVLDSLFVASSCCNVCKIFAITLYQFRAIFLLVLKGEERDRCTEGRGKQVRCTLLLTLFRAKRNSVR